ncbi:MAG: cytochrome c family protein [Deltaproteobacteria bacterium]|nr:cytochrome c family protein [Deltaproteobacteria bacterium]
MNRRGGTKQRIGVLLALVLVALAAGGWSGFFKAFPELMEPGYNGHWLGQNWTPGTAPLRDLRQNHFVHTQKEEIDCETCHPGAKTEARAGIIDEKGCADCHDQADRGQKDKGECLFCHTLVNLPPGCTAEGCPEDKLPTIHPPKVGPKPYQNLRYPSGQDKGGFSHAKHDKAKIPCSDCHGDVAKEKGIPFPSGKYMPKPERCLNCHAKDLEHFTHSAHKERGVECADCHSEPMAKNAQAPDDDFRPAGNPHRTPDSCKDCHDPVSRDCESCHAKNTFSKADKPDSHKGNWTEFHGLTASLNEKGLHGKDCLTCHVKSECETCHATTEPKDHTNFWRVRAHGFSAESNRERCANCHKQDFCVSCHSETAPRSHLGNWRGQHCTWCHIDGSGGAELNNCRACHLPPRHAAAPHPLPVRGQTCTNCH